MRVSIILLAISLAVVAGAPNRIVGGSITSIGNYPFAVALLYSPTASGTFTQYCGGAIINNRSVLSAAHCFDYTPNDSWRSRVGSTYAASGGVVHVTARIIRHPNYDRYTLDSDIAIIRIVGAFSFNNNVRAGFIASDTYVLPDNQVVWAIGWGHTQFEGTPSNELRHVQVWTINRDTCRNRYSAKIYILISDNMLCSGWLDVGGRDQCQQDSGGPLLHNNNIVGVSSFGHECGNPNYPGVNAFVPRFSNWIVANR